MIFFVFDFCVLPLRVLRGLLSSSSESLSLCSFSSSKYSSSAYFAFAFFVDREDLRVGTTSSISLSSSPSTSESGTTKPFLARFFLGLKGRVFTGFLVALELLRGRPP